MMHLDPYLLQHSSCFLRQGNKTSLLMKFTCLFLLLIGFFGLSYFFEDLPIEMKVAARERAHPGLKCFYQQGFMHNLLGNFECNVLGIGESYPEDAAGIYHTLRRRFSQTPKVLAENHPVSFPSRTYTAEYENVQSNDPRGPDRRRISCNGKGLLIYEWNKLRFLYDAHKQLEYIIDPSEKKVYIHRLKQTGGDWLDEEMFSQSHSEFTGYKQFGEEKMIGHNCRVYVNEFHPGTEKRWYDKNTKVLVYRKLGGTSMTLVTKLLKYNSQALPTTEFELPKDYEVTDCTK